MRIIIRCLLVAVVVALASTSVLATDGYFMHGYGTRSKGMAGAGAAIVFGPVSPATNPGSLVFTDGGVEFGLGVFSPDRQYQVTGNPSGYPGTFGLAPGVVQSASRFFPVPNGGVAWKRGATAFGISMFANGGMNTNYNSPTFGAAPVGVNLSQMFIAPTIATTVAGKHGIGVSPVIGYQRFEAKGLAAFADFSSSPANLTNNQASSALGFGVRVGYLGEVSKQLSVAASYQTRIYMGRFDKYVGLFAGNGDFDVPSNWVIGVAVKPNDKVDVAFDVQQVRYSEINSVGNHLLPNLMSAALGTSGGAGFGWDDMTTVKTGLQYHAAGGWTWRGGYSYGNQPVPSTEMLFNILAPGVIEQHASFGLTKELGGGRSLSAAITRAFSKSVTGPNLLEAPGQQQITLKMSQWDVEIGYSIKF